MQWSEVIARPTDRKLREFAAIAAILCIALAIWQGASNGSSLLLGVYAALAGVLGILRIARPRWLGPIFTGWMILAFPIAWSVSMLVLLLLFYGLITPIALVFRLLGRDALDRELRPDQNSYWTKKSSGEQPRSYLRQF